MMMLVLLFSSILSAILIWTLMIIGIIFIIYMILTYILFCIGIKRLCQKNLISEKFYWLPIYNLYLFGKNIDIEIGYKNKTLEYSKYMIPIGFLLLQFLIGKWFVIGSCIYFIYIIYCNYHLGKKYQIEILITILSVFNLQGLCYLWISKKHKFTNKSL